MSLWSKLGIPEPDLQDGGPEVDDEIILSVVRHELPEPVARAVYRQICTWKSWQAAHIRVLLAELRRTRSAK